MNDDLSGTVQEKPGYLVVNSICRLKERIWISRKNDIGENRDVIILSLRLAYYTIFPVKALCVSGWSS